MQKQQASARCYSSSVFFYLHYRFHVQLVGGLGGALCCLSSALREQALSHCPVLRRIPRSPPPTQSRRRRNRRAPQA